MKQWIESIWKFGVIFTVFILHCEAFCDDGKKGIEIDLHGESDWKCMGRKWSLDDINKTEPLKKCYYTNSAYGHVCIDKPIDHLYPEDDIPNRGPHREVWAAYGEYKYVPPGRYVHNLEHGGVLFLYHPCAPTEMVDRLRTIAETCTWKYLLAAFPNLTQEYPLAVLTYSCVYKMSQINSSNISSWVRSKFGKSPEPDVFGQGNYNYSLIKLSSKPTTVEEGKLFCPAVPKPKPSSTPTPTPRTDEVFWAVGSLVFLCAVLMAAICYTKLWRSRPGYDPSGPKLWRDGNSHESMSVAAVVRNLPHMVKTKIRKPHSKPSSSHYTLIEDSMSATDEEL